MPLLQNRLADESSLYLHQHAKNPVAWQPWDDAALAAAKERDLPIFLSIGYSACHWCHVMEHESFENPRVAELMNQWFVNIKVDREERPDLDTIYMSAVTALTGQGGWPMSVFLTPDLRPFYGGTYFPPTSHYGRPGFPDLLHAIHDAWLHRRPEIYRQAEGLTESVNEACAGGRETSPLSVETLDKAGRNLVRIFDRVAGGLGHAPKFPHPLDLRLALRLADRFDADELREVGLVSLSAMARGGIYDQLAGGFARYSTDAEWLAPHFEKMLYDNALLIPAYLEAWQITGEEHYRTVVTETCDYLLREMLAPGQAFYSTQDADSEGEEGRYFVWSQAEIREVLGDDADFFSDVYDVTSGGNWEGKNILRLKHSLTEVARSKGMPLADLLAKLKPLREKLLARRRTRIAPGRDEKQLVNWNGLAISALATAGAMLQESRYLAAARQAAGFIVNTLIDANGRLSHSYQGGESKFAAYLDDYACLIDGLVDLYLADFDSRRLESAVALAAVMRTDFEDAGNGGFYYTARDSHDLITRPRDFQDNATPNGNSVAAFALLRLGRLTGNAELTACARRSLEAASGLLSTIPLAAAKALATLDDDLGPNSEIVLFPGTDVASMQTLIAEVRTKYRPRSLFIVADRDESSPLLAHWREGRDELLNRHPDEPILFVCEGRACSAPVIGHDAVLAALGPA